MVKRNKLFLLFALVGATLVGCGSVNSSILNESATDILGNNKGIRFAADAESFVGSDEVVAYSPTYVQYGTNPTSGNKVLRFATAVKGAITSINYTRAPIEGETVSHVKEVYLLYAGIMASGENQYYTSEGLSTAEEDKGQYYWACYSIEYSNESKYGIDVDVTFSIDGEVVNTKQANLQNMIDADEKLYKSIYIDGDVNVQHGQNINTAEFVVKAVNHDGSEITLDPADYSITNSKVARFGESATVEIVHNQDSSLTATTDVITTRRVQGESGIIVGGKAVEETEYTINNDQFTSGEKVGAAGGFSGTVNGGNEGSLTLTYVSKTDHVGGLTMRVSNSNLAKDGNYYYMKPLQLNSIVDISLNGNILDVSNDVVIPGTPTYTAKAGAYAPLYNIYNLVTLDNISFKAGVNTFKFNFKMSTISETNSWKESPSEFNVDYVDFYSTGSVIEEMDTEAGLTLDEASFTMPAYGTTISALTESSLRAFGTTKSGNIVPFERDELNVTLSGGDHSYMVGTEDHIVFGEHTLAFNLVENEELSGTYTFNVRTEDNTNIGLTRIQSASIEVVDNRAYYVIKGTSRGVKPGDVELFDGSTVIPSEWTFGLNTYTCRVDVTDFAVGSTSEGKVAFWPHFRVNGVNWDGKNGDVKLSPSSYNNTIVYCNNKRFQLCGDSYDMPVVYVGTLDYSDKDAVITDTSIVQEGDKVYYQLTGYAYNVSLDKIVLKELDSSTRTVVTDSVNPFKFIFKYDVTNRSAGNVWPHITVDGKTYANGGTAGDLKGQHRATANGIKIGTSDSTEKDFGNSITANGKIYKITVQYGMPTLRISNA